MNNTTTLDGFAPAVRARKAELDAQIMATFTTQIVAAVAAGAHSTSTVETAVLGEHPYFSCDKGLFNRAFRNAVADRLVVARYGAWYPAV